jgi:hypothetical protein
MKENAPTFSAVFSPYRSRYLAQRQNLGLFDNYPDTEWFSIERYLTDTQIDQAILGNLVLGYYLTICPHAFCLDIDDHSGRGEGFLLSVYDRVCRKLHGSPSILCKSPHGLHAHYFLTHPVPEILLVDRLRAVMEGTPVEVRPTHQMGLRIPQEQNLLDPETLRPLTGKFADLVQAALRYHPVELLNDGISPEALRSALKERSAKAIHLKAWQRLAQIEATYQGIQPGTTNEALCELIPVYRNAGLGAEAAAAEFSALLAPEYTGELRTFSILIRRVRSFYKHIPETRFTIPQEQQEEDLFTQEITRVIAAVLTGPIETRYQRAALTKKRKTVIKAVRYLESWRLYLEEVISSRRFLEMWNYLYPYFKKNTKEGYYPIPSNTFKKIHHDYERWLLPFFEEIGYLERSPYGYSTVFGICYYYKMNGYQLIDTLSASIPDLAPIPEKESKAHIRAEQIRAYKTVHPEATTRIIGEVFGVTAMTVSRSLKGEGL